MAPSNANCIVTVNRECCISTYSGIQSPLYP